MQLCGSLWPAFGGTQGRAGARGAQLRGTAAADGRELISGTGTAHWFGCDHLPDYEYLVPPKYGWIEDRAVWPRIGNHEVKATGGNAARVALRRCLDCDY